VSKIVNILWAALTLRQILCISIYLEPGSTNKVPFGQRATVYRGRADLEGILRAEVAEEHIKRVQGTPEERGKMLVTNKTCCPLLLLRYSHRLVSGTCKVRDRLGALVHAYLDDGVQLQELEFHIIPALILWKACCGGRLYPRGCNAYPTPAWQSRDIPGEDEQGRSNRASGKHSSCRR
jgi:hypothetical protein